MKIRFMNPITHSIMRIRLMNPITHWKRTWYTSRDDSHSDHIYEDLLELAWHQGIGDRFIITYPCPNFGAGISNHCQWMRSMVIMTSPNGNIFRVTGTLCGKSPVTSEFPAQRLVRRSFDVFYDLRLNKRLRKQSKVWWLETPPIWDFIVPITKIGDIGAQKSKIHFGLQAAVTLYSWPKAQPLIWPELTIPSSYLVQWGIVVQHRTVILWWFKYNNLLAGVDGSQRH